MGHSTIDFRGRQVLLDDADVIVVVHAALDASRAAVARAVPGAAALDALLESWRGLMDVYGPGCLELGFDRFICTEADRAALATLLSATRQHLRNQGAVLTADYLNGIVDAPAVLTFEDRETELAVGAVQRVEALLGRVPTP